MNTLSPSVLDLLLDFMSLLWCSPIDWIMTLKSLATVGAIPRARVITCNNALWLTWAGMCPSWRSKTEVRWGQRWKREVVKEGQGRKLKVKGGRKGKLNAKGSVKGFTGKATAPPPSLVIPATIAPKISPIESIIDQNGKIMNRPWKKWKDHGNGKLISVREVGEVIVLERLAPPQSLHQHQRDQDPWSILSYWLNVDVESIFEFYQLLVGVWARLCQGEGRREEGRPKLRRVCRPTFDLGGNFWPGGKI